MKRLFLFITLTIFYSVPLVWAAAPGEDSPIFLINKKDREFLLLRCVELSRETINCEITIMDFRLNNLEAYPADESDEFWESYLSPSSSDYTEIFDSDGNIRTDYLVKFCDNIDNMQNMVDALNGLDTAKQKMIDAGATHDSIEKFLKKDPREIKYLVDRSNAFIEVCKNPTIKNFKLMAMKEFEAERATCTPFIYSLKRTFSKQSQDYWFQTVEPNAEDECEVITLYTLSRPSGSRYDWSYSEKSKSLSIELEGNSCLSSDMEKLYLRNYSAAFFGCDFMQ